MEDIALYCKSYQNDVHRVRVLLESIKQFNRDNIKFFISCPSSDIKLFESVLGTSDYTLLQDEDITKMYSGWLGQQIVKAEFWKLNLCENYLVLDSDSQFIRNFYRSDFLYEGMPYTVIQETKHFFEFMYKFPLHFDPYESFVNERKAVMEVFDRKGAIYDFGNSPAIWSRKVWESMKNDYLTPNELTIEQIFQTIPSELTWYGEWLLTSKVIPIYPKEPLFRSFSYKHMYEKEKQEGMTLDILKKLYLGIVMPSSWGAPLRF